MTIEVSFGNIATTLGVLESFFGIADWKRCHIGFEKSCSRMVVAGVNGHIRWKGPLETIGIKLVSPGSK